jgi:hypothetical protein
MRRLIISSCSALLTINLLIINLLIGAGSPAAAVLRPVSPPVQATAGERGAARSAQESDSLEPGKPIERELSGGQSHSYKITIVSGQYLKIAVEQRGIDVGVALSTPDGNRNSGADSQPLIGSHEVVSLPSASTLATLRRETAGRKPAEKSLAVLADPVFADDDIRVKRLAGKTGVEGKTGLADAGEKEIASLQMSRSGQEIGAIDRGARFGRLLNTRREATAISALVPERERKQALDFEASRATALNPNLDQYRIVHFATHGLLNNIHPELSGIVLSLVDKEGEPQDGFLRLQDIYNLKLPAELVVLSACQTGLGKEIKGEGLVGLTRGFMYAGTPRIVASLWKVDDRATSELMKRFYQGVLGPERLRPAEALRQAQLSIWKQNQWRAPFYWAAFVLQGEWR